MSQGRAGQPQAGAAPGDRARSSSSRGRVSDRRRACRPARAGDAIFMSYLLVHGSGVNVSTSLAPPCSSRCATPRTVADAGTPSRGQGTMLAGASILRERRSPSPGRRSPLEAHDARDRPFGAARCVARYPRLGDLVPDWAPAARTMRRAARGRPRGFEQSSP